MEARSMEPQPAEDTCLVQETLGGNQASFQLLVERYQSRMFALARHYTKNPVEVEDLVQDTFLKAYARLDSFQHQASFYTWLYRIGTNTALDWMKRRGRSPVTVVEDPEVVGEPAKVKVAAPDAQLERQEIAKITHEVLAHLP